MKGFCGTVVPFARCGVAGLRMNRGSVAASGPSGIGTAAVAVAAVSAQPTAASASASFGTAPCLDFLPIPCGGGSCQGQASHAPGVFEDARIAPIFEDTSR